MVKEGRAKSEESEDFGTVDCLSTEKKKEPIVNNDV